MRRVALTNSVHLISLKRNAACAVCDPMRAHFAAQTELLDDSGEED